jgi:uncharacterized protein YndB with AHSA1/START domain
MLMKVLLAIGAVVVVVIIGLLITIALQPATFSVTRSATIDAPPEVVFDQVNTLRNWEGWNPWGKLDPNMQLTYEGPSSGPGASYAWSGDGNVGAGELTITDVKPNEEVQIRLEFFKPFAAVNDTVFTFKPTSGGTQVTWTMSGKNNFMGKAMGLMMDIDKMCGDMFNKGLAEMKKIAEATPAA